jgi:thiamine-phosphate pyrophosphorylase
VRSLTPLYAIVDAAVAARNGREPAALAAAFLAGGATTLQVRAKDLASGALLELCRAIVGLARPYGASVIVNDRADIALLAGADGVHVGQEDLTPADVRTLLGSRRDCRAVHAHADADRAGATRADFVPGGGPGVRALRRNRPATTPSAWRWSSGRWRPRAMCPSWPSAVSRSMAHRAVLGAGAASVAVITDLLVTGDPEARAAEYVQQLGRPQGLTGPTSRIVAGLSSGRSIAIDTRGRAWQVPCFVRSR